MIEGTTFLGIPMDRRLNRRALVLVTYVGGVLVVLGLSLVKARMALPIVMGFATLWFLIAFFVFGRIVSPFFLVPWFGRAPQVVDRGMGLTATVAPEEPPRDEREIALRNAAYHSAYKILVAAGLIAVGIVEVTVGMAPRQRGIVLNTVMIFLFVLAFTMPQAVVLWQERDFTGD